MNVKTLIFRAVTIAEKKLTSPTLVAQIGKSPNRSKSYTVSNAGQHELQLVGPVIPPRFDEIAVGVFGPAIETFSVVKVFLRWPETSSNRFSVLMFPEGAIKCIGCIYEQLQESKVSYLLAEALLNRAFEKTWRILTTVKVKVS